MFSQDLVNKYLELLPTLLYIMFAAFLMTPLVGYFAMRYGFIDLPAQRRKRTDKTLAQRIHKTVKPRLGGIAYLIPMILLLLHTYSQTNNVMILSISIGLIILTVSGALDDKYEISAKYQMLSQLLAAFIVVTVGGLSIKYIDFVGFNLSFDLWHTSLDIFNNIITITFPADLITIIWILTIINAMNWMYGIDAIGEAVSIISSITTGLLCMKAGLPEYALISFALGFSILGFLPFNFNPSKIIGGTAGATGTGFMLAVLSILSGAKLTNTMIILLFPLFDMIWVVLYRLKTHTSEPFLKRPFISGKVHFHHRLLTLGLSQRKILLVETIIISAIAILGLYAGGFSNTFIFLIIAICILLIIFSLISSLAKKKEKKLIENIRKKVEVENQINLRKDDDDIPPEQRYAY